MSSELKAVKAQFEGRCLGGPYDGQKLAHDGPRYPIIMYCSTADVGLQAISYSEAASAYVWTDSTWVWNVG